MPAKTRPFRLADLNVERVPSQLSVSPDGAVAMAVSELSADGCRTVGRVWLLDASEREGARPITAPDRRAGLPCFSPDGARLAYLAERENDKMQLVVLTRPFSEPVQVTSFDAGATHFSWLDDRRLLVLAVPDKPEREKKAVEQKDDAYVVDADEPQTRMFIVGAAGGRAKPIGPKSGHVSAASAARDGRRAAFIHCAHSTQNAIWQGSTLNVLDARTGRARKIRDLSAPAAAGTTPVFSPDGTRIAFVDSPKKGLIYPHRVFVIGAEGGRAVMVDRALDRVTVGPDWLDDATLSFVDQVGVRRVLRAAPATGGPGRDLVDFPGVVLEYAVAPDGRVYYTFSEADRPGDVRALDADGHVTDLTALNRRFDGVALSKPEVLEWKSKEGWSVEGIFYPPTGRAKKPWPTVLIPHGGPHASVSLLYDPRVQMFAARGYAVFMPNFRGSTGYGTDFMMSILKDWGPGPADDIVRGLKFLIRTGRTDREHIVIHGGSFGGYMTAWLIGHFGGMFRAAVAVAPVVNNISMWGTTDIPSFKEWSYGGNPYQEYARYWKMSPVSALAKCRVPTLVITGDKDVRVPVGQSQELYRSIQAAGAPTELVRYPREPHGLNEPRHKTDALKRVLAWYEEHMGKDAPTG